MSAGRKAGSQRLFLASAAFLVILAVFLGMRLWDFQRAYSKDEVTVVWPAEKHVGPRVFNLHPPLTIGLYTLGFDLLGRDNLRLLPIAFSVAAFVLSWLLAERHFGRRTAAWAAALSAVSYYSVIASQMIDMDGAVTASIYLCGLLALFSFVDSDYWDWRAGAVLGLAIGACAMARIVGWAIYFPFLAYPLLRKRMRPALFWPLAIPLLMVGGWVAIDYATNGGEAVRTTFSHAGGQTIQMLGDLRATFIDKARFLYVLQRKFTPALSALLAASLFLAWKDATKKKDPRLLTILACIAFVFALYAAAYGGDKIRYLMVALPLAFLVCGRFLSERVAVPGVWDVSLFLSAAGATFFALHSGHMTEWETTSNFAQLTLAKVFLAVLPALAFLLLRKRRAAIVFLLASFFAFSLYYSAVASTEKDSSELVSGLAGRLDGTTIVFGEYGLPFYLQARGITSGFVAEDPSDPGGLVATGAYFNYLTNRDIYYPGQVRTARMKRADFPAFLESIGARYFVVTKKIIVSEPVDVPQACSKAWDIERGGENQGTVYACTWA